MNTNENKTKTYTQQLFHKGIFETRPRSSSISNDVQSEYPELRNEFCQISQTQNESSKQIETLHNNTPEQNMDGTEDYDIGNSHEHPPPWQRIPERQGAKRKKPSESPSPEALKTSNKFSGLQVDQTEQQPETSSKKAHKPPPIILYGIEDLSKLTELLNTVAERETFNFKNVNRNQLRINCGDVEVYKKIVSIIRENGLIGHTFNIKQNRCFRIVIRNLHPSTPHEIIREEIEATGNIIQGEIINAKYGPDKIPTSTFFVNLLPSEHNKLIKELKYIYNQSVIIEDPKKRKSIVQCQRCQQYGHSKNYCMRPYRCVKCTEPHKTSDCPKRERNTPAQCVLCNGAHPANYKGCQVYREIAARKLAKNGPNIDKNSQRPPAETRRITNTDNNRNHNYANKKTKTTQQKTYAEAASNAYPQHYEMEVKKKPTFDIENLLIEQSKKFDLILQQMSTLMGLIVKLVDKLAK